MGDWLRGRLFECPSYALRRGSSLTEHDVEVERKLRAENSASSRAEPRERDGRRAERGLAITSSIDTHGTPPNALPFGIVQRRLDARTSVIAVEGELDLFTAPSLKQMLVDALQEGSDRLVVDLASVTFIDSTTLGVLVGIARRLDEDEARLAIVCTRPNVQKIFEFSGLDGKFAIFPTLDEALAYTRGKQACAS